MRLTHLRRLGAAAAATVLVSASALVGAPALAADADAVDPAAAAVTETTEPAQSAPEKSPEKPKPEAKPDQPKVEKQTKTSETAKTPAAKQARGGTEPPAPAASPSPSPSPTPTPTDSPDPTPTPTPTDGDPAEKPVIHIDETITPKALTTTGITIKVTNLQPGDIVMDSVKNEEHPAEDDSVTYQLVSSQLQEVHQPGQKYPVAVTVTRDGVQIGERNVNVEIVADEDEKAAFDPKVTVSDTRIKVSDASDPKKGITVKASNLAAGDVVSDPITAKEHIAEGGDLTYKVVLPEAPKDLELPSTVPLTVTVTREGEKPKDFEFTITLIADDDETAPAFDPKVTTGPKKLTAAEMADPEGGISISALGLQPGDVVVDSLLNEKRTADGEGVEYNIFWDGDPADLKPGVYPFTVSVTRGEETKTFDFSYEIVTEDDGEDGDEEQSAVLTINPEKITVADFRSEKKGVEIAVTGCAPGDEVYFDIYKTDDEEMSFHQQGVADENGVAAMTVYGQGNAADSLYLGKYEVWASCSTGEVSGSFTVVKGGDGKGGGDTDRKGRSDRDGSTQLPRTGTDMGALLGAAALLTVGGAALALTRRRPSGK